jgi:hypothetical protein
MVEIKDPKDSENKRKKKRDMDKLSDALRANMRRRKKLKQKVTQ